MPTEGISGSSILLRLGAVLALVLLNAFFVASEFALIGARATRLSEMATRGDRLARLAHSAVLQLDRYLSATQLGITIASLALGWIGEPAFAAIIDMALATLGVNAPPGAAHATASVFIAFTIITFLHVVYGELAPKSLALVMPERLSGLLILPLMLFTRLMTPLIRVLNGVANVSLRMCGVQPVSELKDVHSPEELRLVVRQSHAHGVLGESDSAMLAGVLDFHAKKTYDVMRPRTSVVAIGVDASEADVRALIRRERYSRYPVFETSLDDVIGVLVAKDVLFVPATRSAARVLDDFRKKRPLLAVVLDEYGGMSGIVTIEDLIEEVIGDIADEHDQPSRESIEVDGVIDLAGNTSLVDVRSDYRINIPAGRWTTLGGYVFSQLGRLPQVGDVVAYADGDLQIIALEGKRIATVRVRRSKRT